MDTTGPDRSGKVILKTYKRNTNIQELHQQQHCNNLPNNNINNEISSKNDDNIIYEISDDSEEPEINNKMAKNKPKNDKFYINCYSKIIERLKFQTTDAISPKKLKINESLNDNQDNSIHKSDEIIGIESMSSCKISDNDVNCIIKTSSYSSSELIDSSQSLSLNQIQFKTGVSLRPMLKNTIPSDSFQKFLDSLEKKYTKLSSQDKVISWDYSSDISEVEDVIDFEERRKLLRLLYRDNNKKNVSTTKDINLQSKKLLRSSVTNHTNNNNSNMINTPSPKRKNLKNNKPMKNEKILKKNINSPKISPSSTNSGWSTDYNKDDKLINSLTTIINNMHENITTPRTSTPGTARTNKLIQIRKDYGCKLINNEKIFKIPNVPRKYLPSINNKIEAYDQKEEFYKYLGLGTKSSENDNNYNSSVTNNAAAAAELKRRSLRVRRLQLYQQNNNKKVTDNKERYESILDDDNEVSVKANGQLRLHQSDETALKETPKIQIICSLNSNANNKNSKTLENLIPKNGKNVQNKSIIYENTSTQSQLSQIPENSNNISIPNMKNNKQLGKRSHSITNQSTGELTDEEKSPVTHLNQKELNSENGNSESLIIVKRSYQQSAVPTKRINPIIIPNVKSHLKNDYFNKCKKISILIQDQINEKDKIKIEFSKDYSTTKINNTNNKLLGIEKSSQTLKHNYNDNFTLQESANRNVNPIIINNNKTRSCTKENLINDKTNINQNPEFKNSISDIVDTNKTRSSTPSECKVLIEKLTNHQINNEFSICNNNNIKEKTVIVKNLNDQQNFILKSKKNRKIWTKSKNIKIRRTNLNQSRILRNKKIIKLIKKPINISDKLRKVRKERKNSEKSINLHGPAKIAKMIVTPTTININNNIDDIIFEQHLISLENIENNNFKASIEKATPPKKTEIIINEEEIKPFKKINDNLLDVITQNLLPNPLKFEKGDVLHAYYECEFLIVVQEFSISFWKYSKVIQMLGEPQEWELLGECKRKLIDEEIFSPYKNRICINDSNPVYIELRARQLPNDNRECNLASPYINIYYFDIWKDLVSQQSIQLDTIKCLSKYIAYTTIINSRYFIMCWKQDTILGTHRTGLCKYALTPDLETLASIRDFKNLRHIVYNLECCDDDKLIGFGESQITIWDHKTGDVLTNFDLGISIGKNLGSLISSIEFEKYLFIYQLFHNEDIDDLPELKIIAITISLNTPSFRLVYSHELPLQFIAIKSSLNTNDYCIITAVTGEEIWMMSHHPQRLLFMNEEIATSSKRFYSTDSCNFIEITGDYLNVKKIHENLLNIITT